MIARYCLEFVVSLFATILYLANPAYSPLYPAATALAFAAFALTRRIGKDRVLLSPRALDEREVALIARTDRVSLFIYFGLFIVTDALMEIFKLFLYPGEGTRRLYIDIAFYARPFSYATAFFLLNAAVGLAASAGAMRKIRRSS
jgi:hypothetical protein